MKRIILLFVGLFVVSSAHATLIFSDVTYTANSVSFRTTGDLSGYSSPNLPQYFSIGFEGDLYTTGIYQNVSWSNAIFDGATVVSAGYSGDWNNWNTPGAWLQLSPSLSSSSSALGVITTLTLGANVLNEASLIGELVFNWSVDTTFTNHTELGRISIASVPEPSTIAMLGIGLVGLGFYRKKQIKKRDF